MNEAHLKLCSSPDWARLVETELLPWVLGNHDLGDDVLEVGPGPGLTTDVLRRHVARLTVVEVDEGLATDLKDRLAGTNVEVVHGDATVLSFEPGHFSAAALFNVLHHVPSAKLQDRLLVEVRRTIQAGGIIIGTDNIENAARWELHVDDTYVPIDPSAFEDRLMTAGFVDVTIEIRKDRFMFVAAVPK
jgi:SAM-dependent methyltransferase